MKCMVVNQYFHRKFSSQCCQDFIEEQNFEACKAVKDSIREWFTKHGVEISADATLIIPDKSTAEFHGHISLGRADDPFGMASGGSFNF